MGVKIVQDSSLSAVADAIRAKTGKSDAMEFPDEFVSEIGSISGGGGSGATINGRRFTCGTVTLTEDTLSFQVQHGLGVTPEAAFVWCVDAPTKDSSDANISSAVGGMGFIEPSSYNKSVVLRTLNGNYVTGIAGNYGIQKDSTYITATTYSTYLWKAGYEYQWLAIAPENE